MRFGRQRPPRDVYVFALLLVGFSGLALAFWLLTANWLGVLLPIGYLLGVYATLRAEVREIELRGDTLFLRTFFRTYPIPRTHIRALHGSEIEVLNGNRYAVVPAEADAEEVRRALAGWLLQESHYPS
jgi:cytochrome bd-type quinol oxidase subunit 1